jgi:hypothetical protein
VILTDAHTDLRGFEREGHGVARVLRFEGRIRRRPETLKAAFFHRCGKLVAVQRYLEALLATGIDRKPHVAVMDSDMLFAAPIVTPFRSLDFDIALTYRMLRDPGPGKEFNTGVMLLHGARLERAAALLRTINQDLCPALPDFELNDQYVWSIISNLDILGGGEVRAAVDSMGRGAAHRHRRGTLRGFRRGPSCWTTRVEGEAYRILMLDAAVYNTMFLPFLTILPGGRIMQLGKGRYEVRTSHCTLTPLH